jgi:Pentapeptide repeats (8 copies)
VEASDGSLRGATFDHSDLAGARFLLADLTGARFEQADLSRVVMRGVELRDAEISGDVSGLSVNGVAVGPLIEAELDRRQPERVKMRPDDPAGFREAWELVQQRWDEAGGPDGHRAPGPRRVDRRVTGREHHTRRGRRLARTGQLSGAGVPLVHSQRGVGAPPVRRTRPERPGGPIPVGRPAQRYAEMVTGR